MPCLFQRRLLFACFLATVGCVRLMAQSGFALAAQGFDSHVELSWAAQSGAASYKIRRSTDGQNFSTLKTTAKTTSLDFTGFLGSNLNTFYYQIDALDGAGAALFSSQTTAATVTEQSDSVLLDMVQCYTFRYFWDFAHPTSSMARERNTSGDIVTTGGTGFGVMAIVVGVKRGFVTREAAVLRLLNLVSFLGFADRFHGVFPHWLDGSTGNVVPFSAQDDGGDLVETAFLMEGLLTARQFFDQNEPYETALRQAITKLWEDVDWNFYRKNGSGVLFWHWSPTYSWTLNHEIRGWNEAMMVYMLAIASPTHAVPPSLWQTGWTASGYTNGGSWFGQKLFVGPNRGGPLFFSHYSFLGFDPRNRKDAFCNYFQQNVAHSRINQAYCASNPKNFVGYAANSWGLTASDDPSGYLAHEPNNDNGTISPTAALSSMPYTPTESMAALRHFYREKGASIWGEMGFVDAFNETKNWVADSYLAIDEGPIIGMIENFRSGLLWQYFMKNPEIEPALAAIGFMPDLVSTDEKMEPAPFKISPNLILETAVVEGFSGSVLDVFSADGRLVQRIFLEKKEARFVLNLSGWPSGVYFFRNENRVVKAVKI